MNRPVSVLSLFLFFLWGGIMSSILHAQAPAKLPALNQSVWTYVTSVEGTKVKRGECWDLAAEALNRAEATWDGAYRFGRRINPRREVVLPGDIIQFEGVKISYQEGPYTYQETMKHHTAIVYEVIGPGVYRIAHQNNHFSGRKVGISKLDLATVIKGKIMIYRPEA